MSSIFKFTDYKRFLIHYISFLPKKGHGEISRIANFLNVNQALISQIVRGPKDFTLEQGHQLISYLGLSSIEGDYFLLLIEKERAGNHALKKYFESKLENLRAQSKQVAKRIEQDLEMSEKDKAIFYSSWLYSTVRLLTSIEKFQTPESLAQHLNLSRAKTNEILRFLVKCGLCQEHNGRFQLGPRRTHLDRNSPFTSRHHINWRVKALQNVESLREEEMMFTAPLAVSYEHAQEIRDEIVNLIQKISNLVKETNAESLFCFNVDLFEVLK